MIETGTQYRPTKDPFVWICVALFGLVTVPMVYGEVREALEPVVLATVGDDVSQTILVDELGATESLATGETLVLLTFDSGCAWCIEHAPLWRAWLDDPRTDLRIVAASKEPLADAQAFATEQGWSVDVRQIRGLSYRTPWIFVISPEGRILNEVYGGDIDDLNNLLDEYAPTPIEESQ